MLDVCYLVQLNGFLPAVIMTVLERSSSRTSIVDSEMAGSHLAGNRGRERRRVRQPIDAASAKTLSSSLYRILYDEAPGLPDRDNSSNSRGWSSSRLGSEESGWHGNILAHFPALSLASNYPRRLMFGRPSASSTPTWVEIHLFPSRGETTEIDTKNIPKNPNA